MADKRLIRCGKGGSQIGRYVFAGLWISGDMDTLELT